MTNSKEASPNIKIMCADRVRTFSLNLGGLRALEELMTIETANDEFSVFSDYPWASAKTKDIIRLIWAGFYTDSLDDKEPFTIKKAEEVVDLIGLNQAKGAIEMTMARMLTKEQRDKIARDSEELQKKRQKKQLEMKNLKSKKKKVVADLTS